MKKILIFLFLSFYSCSESPKEIPLTIIHGLPLVDVEIQGQHLQLILDLGSHFSSLSREALDQVHLTKVDKTTQSTDIYGQKFSYPVFSADKIQIGNYLFGYLEFNESPSFNSEFESQTPAELTCGKIGRELFLDKILFIDRRGGKTIVEDAHLSKMIDPRKFSEGEWIEANFELEKEKGIILRLTTDKNEMKELILDTGANLSLIDDRTSLKASIDLSAEKREVGLLLSDGIFLGTFPFHPYDFTDLGFQGILGFDFFDSYLVCIDFVNKKLFLKDY